MPHSNLLVWLAGVCFVSLCRLMVYWCYQKSAGRGSNPDLWNAWFNASLFLSGVLWGSTALFMVPSNSIGHQAFLAFVIGGMVAGAAGAFTSVLAAFYIFSLPALLPIISFFFLLGDEIHIAMGTMTLFFLMLISLTANRMHQDIVHLLDLKYERSTLITNLWQEVGQRKSAQQDLRRQKERVEEIVAQRTVQLSAVNQRLRAILNHAPLIIWALDREGIVTFYDGQGLEKMGLAPEDAVGKSAFELFAKNKSFIDISQRVIAGEFISVTIHHGDDAFAVRYQPIMNTDDRLVGAIGVAIDVTEQTAAKEALHKSEEKYRELVENINDVLYAVDKEGVIAYISPVIESVLGYRPEMLIGNCFSDFISHQDQARFKKDFARGLETDGRQGEYRFVDMNGDTKWCRVSSRAISEGQNNVGIQGVLVDITWSKRLEEQLQRAQKMEALGILAGGVAHDLNNILSGIVSYPELLLLDLPKDSPLWRPLVTIKESGENAAAIVQDLLTLARRGMPIIELLNLNHVVKKCIDAPEIQSLIDIHDNIAITTRLQPGLFNIYGSSIHIYKSISNLIVNAIEAMPDGGSIQISTENQYKDKRVSGFDPPSEGEYAVLSIADSGIGISDIDQSRIFEPFYTRKIMGRSGSGLGMAVVWGTVKDHNGYIDLNSKEGEGARFDLFFPATRDEVSWGRDQEETLDYIGNGERILVVDDMPVQREIATSILKRLEYRPVSVASGEEAIAYIQKHRVDLVILDMIMDPGIDGYETYCRMVEICPGQKTIIASGFSETERVRKTLALGAGRYIKKPYTLSSISKLVWQELKK